MVKKLAEEIEVKEREVGRLRGELRCSGCTMHDMAFTRLTLDLVISERSESISQAVLDQKKLSRTSSLPSSSQHPQTPPPALYLSLLTHHSALKALQAEHTKLQERDTKLSQILATLRTSYNPNYQDMGVLEAVRGWEEVEGVEHVNEVGKKQGEKEEGEKGEEKEEEEEDKWTKERLENELDALLNTDHVSLLLQHDEHVAELDGAEGLGGCTFSFSLFYFTKHNTSLQYSTQHPTSPTTSCLSTQT